MTRSALGILALCLAGAAVSGCATQDNWVGVYGMVKLPDGTSAQLYATEENPTQPDASQNPFNGGIANVIIYTGDDCNPLYYGGHNTWMTLAQDFSSATLTIKKSRFGPMQFNFKSGGQPAPVTVPTPKACADPSDPSGSTFSARQQFVIATGSSATDTYSIGSTSGTGAGMIGALVFQADYNNININRRSILEQVAAMAMPGSESGTTTGAPAPAGAPAATVQGHPRAGLDQAATAGAAPRQPAPRGLRAL